MAFRLCFPGFPKVILKRLKSISWAGATLLPLSPRNGWFLQFLNKTSQLSEVLTCFSSKKIKETAINYVSHIYVHIVVGVCKSCC